MKKLLFLLVTLFVLSCTTLAPPKTPEISIGNWQLKEAAGIPVSDGPIIRIEKLSGFESRLIENIGGLKGKIVFEDGSEVEWTYFDNEILESRNDSIIDDFGVLARDYDEFLINNFSDIYGVINVSPTDVNSIRYYNQDPKKRTVEFWIQSETDPTIWENGLYPAVFQFVEE